MESTEENVSWGLPPPAHVAPSWGARAIYTPSGRHSRGSVELLWDRQSMHGGTEAERKALARWIDKSGLRAVERECARLAVGADEERMVTIRSGGYTIVASPRASYGYLYIGAWPNAGTNGATKTERQR